MTNYLTIIFFLFTSILFGECAFTPDEMRLFTKVEWLQEGPDESGVLLALEEYHSSSYYAYNLETFVLQPDAYFNRRIEALDYLLEVLSKASFSPAVEKLKKQAEKKRLYLQEVPKELNPLYVKAEVFKLKGKPKELNIRDNYWCELLDPLHRAGPEIFLRLDKWHASTIPSFFIYLEGIEYDEGLQHFSPYVHQVVYFDEKERNSRQLTFSDGLAYLNGDLFDSKKFLTLHKGAREVSFVLGPDEELYVCEHLRFKWHHSSLFAGGSVIDAGEIKTKNGRILKLTNKSGHYIPNKETLLKTLTVLEEKSGSLTGIHLKLWQLDSKGKIRFYRVVYDAQEYLEGHGSAIAIDADMSWTPLHAAAWNNDLNAISTVCTPENIDAQDDEGNTPLHLAAEQGHRDCVKMLLGMGARIDVINKKSGDTPLHTAVRKRRDSLIDLLLKSPTAFTLLNDWENSPVDLAAQCSNINTFKVLFDRCAPSFIEKRHYYLFKGAVQNPDLDIYEFCVERFGTETIQQRDVNKNSLMHIAASKGSTELIHRLLCVGLSLEDSNLKGELPLHFAAAGSNNAVVGLILRETSGSQVNQKNIHGENPLMFGAGELSLKSVQAFLDYGVKVLDSDHSGKTVLHHLALVNSNRARRNMTYLIENMASDVQLPALSYDQDGYTPIHLAILNDDLNTTYWLLALTNLGNIRDANGKELIEYARETTNSKLANYLLEKFHK